MSPKWLCRPDVYRDPGDIAPWPGLANQKLIIELAEKSRLPAIYQFKEIVQAGGLMSYGIDLPELGRRVADVVGHRACGHARHGRGQLSHRNAQQHFDSCPD